MLTLYNRLVFMDVGLLSLVAAHVPRNILLFLNEFVGK